MARLQGLSSLDARRFRTGRACLDLAHTGGDGPQQVYEILHEPADVARWLGVIAEIDGIIAGAGDVEATVGLRRAVRAAADAATSGQPPPPAARATINRHAARPTVVPALSEGGPTVVEPVEVGAVLSLLARDAIDLFGGPLAVRIRTCAADDCGLFFVDLSRPGTRRWCSMQRCGTRAKVRRYRQRERET